MAPTREITYMKTMALLAAITILAGCAAAPSGVSIDDVRSPAYFRGERTIPLTFAKIQMALFKHEAACGTSAKLVLEPRETNYATITQMPQPSARSEEHTSELQSLMRISYAVFCLNKKKHNIKFNI